MSNHDTAAIIARVYDLAGKFVGVIEKGATGKLQVTLDAPWETNAQAINHNIATGGRLPSPQHKNVIVSGTSPEDLAAVANTIRILSERQLRVEMA